MESVKLEYDTFKYACPKKLCVVTQSAVMEFLTV